MKSIIKMSFLIAVLVSSKGYSQSFTNLDFENPILPLSPVFNQVPTSDAIPGWNAYYSTATATNVTSSIFYDTISLGGAFIALEDTNASSLGPAPLQGSCSVLLLSSTADTPTSASIGQTGTIPVTANTLSFWGNNVGGMQITFNGQTLSFMDISNTLNYTIYGADISAYAGQTGQLLFTALASSSFSTGGEIDNIQFSSIPIPEPSAFGLVALGGLLLGYRRWRNSSR